MFFQMNQLLDLWVVALKDSVNRFQLNVLLNSVFFNKRIILRVVVKKNTTVDTLTNFICV